MLARLGHHRLVRRHHQHGEIYPADPRQHIVDEALMPRHVNYAHLVAARQFKPGEAQVNRQPALLLLGKPVGVNSGERLDEGGFSVVNMARGSDYKQVSHPVSGCPHITPQTPFPLATPPVIPAKAGIQWEERRRRSLPPRRGKVRMGVIRFIPPPICYN